MISRNAGLQAIYDATWGRVYAGAYDWFLSRAEEAGLSNHRKRLVSHAKGRTLEIATGTGLNLSHYTNSVTELVLTEPYSQMISELREKVERSGRRAEVIQAWGEDLPFRDHSFDTVVATMILCTAEQPQLVLREIARVLKPDGQYLFLEHVRNPDSKIAKRQDRIQPLWYIFGNGCHCNRDAGAILKESPLVVDELNWDRIPRAWSIVEAMITGRARPSGKIVECVAGPSCCAS